MGDAVIKAAVAAGTKDLVIEGLRGGNAPPSIVVAQKIPVIICARCFEGMSIPAYAYAGAGAYLEHKGLINSV